MSKDPNDGDVIGYRYRFVHPDGKTDWFLCRGEDRLPTDHPRGEWQAIGPVGPIIKAEPKPKRTKRAQA